MKNGGVEIKMDTPIEKQEEKKKPKRRRLKRYLILLLVGFGLLGVLVYNPIRSLGSLERVHDFPVYVMHYYGDYGCKGSY